jgi:hypothetical protein
VRETSMASPSFSPASRRILTCMVRKREQGRCRP